METERLAGVSRPKRSLPPLILHPFSDSSSEAMLAPSTRASLVLQGLLQDEGLSEPELKQRVLQGRYCEVRMLFYLGKDLSRWLDQCMELVDREEELRQFGIQRGSFANLLVESPPSPVQEKLRSWGVVDFKTIFRRALGLHVVFTTLPERDSLSEDFLRSYHRFADCLFGCSVESSAAPRLRQTDFQFEIYTSGEYAKRLEKEWGAQ
jgi:hypothetical protein